MGRSSLEGLCYFIAAVGRRLFLLPLFRVRLNEMKSIEALTPRVLAWLDQLRAVALIYC
jgi:hypothetical protein